jgi:mannose-6-phosphate isomerase-like protein (cupin superfamily)
MATREARLATEGTLRSMQPPRIDRDGVRKAWAERGFTCELWIDPPSQIWQDFEHDVDELVLLLDGTCHIEMNGRTLRLTGGDELLIPAGTRHTVRNCGEGPARWLHGYREAEASA